MHQNNNNNSLYSLYSLYNNYSHYNNYNYKKTKAMPSPQVLLPQINWSNLHFYQKSDTLYQLTATFCRRFLPPYGDRTVDQMIQAARSGKQNIVEGLADGKSSTEMQLKLLNVARASIQELREDYNDFLRSKQMEIWAPANQRYQPMVDFCKQHNNSTDYEPFFEKWSAEEMANIALTLCHMTDTMMNKFLKRLEQDFVTQGGIKERMYAARTGYHKQQDDRMAALEAENRRLKFLLDAHGIKY